MPRVGKKRNAHQVLVGKPEERGDHSEDLVTLTLERQEYLIIKRLLDA